MAGPSRSKGCARAEARTHSSVKPFALRRRTNPSHSTASRQLSLTGHSTQREPHTMKGRVLNARGGCGRLIYLRPKQDAAPRQRLYRGSSGGAALGLAGGGNPRPGWGLRRRASQSVALRGPGRTSESTRRQRQQPQLIHKRHSCNDTGSHPVLPI